MLTVRKSTISDLPEMQEIFKTAREYMKKTGNPTQWGDDRPPLEYIKKDIERGESFVILDGDKIVGTFYFAIGVEPTYIEIDGKWLNDEPYGTIHRIASDQKTKGIFSTCINFCESFGVDIRIDTHKSNKTMLHLIEKFGFKRCGVILTDDNTEREAFQRIKI